MKLNECKDYVESRDVSYFVCKSKSHDESLYYKVWYIGTEKGKKRFDFVTFTDGKFGFDLHYRKNCTTTSHELFTNLFRDQLKFLSYEEFAINANRVIDGLVSRDDCYSDGESIFILDSSNPNRNFYPKTEKEEFDNYREMIK